MVKGLVAPNKYISGKGIVSELYGYVKGLGQSFLFVCDNFIVNDVKETVAPEFENNNAMVTIATFQGECSRKEINRLVEQAKEANSQCIIGVGGGKTLDTAKAVAYYAGLPVVVVPTIASTDAPCSALSVIYTEDGQFEEVVFFPYSPSMVIVDTQVIANAPTRLLVAGIGDALATYFEARISAQSNSDNTLGMKPTKTALSLSKLCYDILLEDSLKAIYAVENNQATKALENIIEANIYLSGIGFESGGLAAAHAIHNGFTALEETHHMYHGEKVAFGTIVQLVLEDVSHQELEEVIQFCIAVGLPVTLRQLGIQEINPDDIMKVATLTCAEGETIVSMPFEVTPEDVYAAIIVADTMGKSYL